MNKNRVIIALKRTTRVGATATVLLSAGLIVNAPSKAFAQEMATDSAPNSESIPVISIVRPASGQAYTAILTVANGYVHPQSGGTAISGVTVVIRRTKGGNSQGYLNGSGAFVPNRVSLTADVRMNKQNQQVWSVGFTLPSGDYFGSYNIQAVATNVAGKQNSATASFTIETVAQKTVDQAKNWAVDDQDAYIAKYGEDTDCGHFISRVMGVTGADPGFPLTTTTQQQEHMLNSPLWQTGNMASWQPKPGDVLNITAAQKGTEFGHTAFYAGQDSQGRYMVYQGSLGGHIPQIGYYTSLDSLRSRFRIWGRLK